MTYQELEHITEVVKKVEENSFTTVIMIVCAPFVIIGAPFVGIWKGAKWLYTRFFPKKLEAKVKSKIKPHVTPQPNTGRFLFRKDRHPLSEVQVDKIAFIENAPTPEIDKFLEKDKAWLQYWQDWYGLDIIYPKPADIREDMVYPEDFPVFKHGFIWMRGMSSSDGVNNDKTGVVARYFELDPSSAKSLREQMKDIANLLYEYYYDF